MRNSNLIRAKQAKNDEFYTRIEDIEKELCNYTDCFKDKTVLCNCDDPFESNFFKFFALQFKELNLKKLITTNYCGSAIKKQNVDLLDEGAYSIVMDKFIGDYNHDGCYDLQDVELWLQDQKKLLMQGKKSKLSLLQQGGDFASEECVKLLDEADVVVTNPPFSLWRKYVSLLMEHKKQFLIIGNMNAITYKEIFPLIKENKLWMGYTFNKSLVFNTPYKNTNEKNKKIVTGRGFDDNHILVSAVCWFTNLPVEKREEYLDLFENYSPDKYPMYDNYLAINVDRVSDIPCNEWFIMTVGEDRYNKLKATYGDDFVLIDSDDVNKQYRIKVRNIVMGVPITFLDKYCPKQFCIIGHEHDLEGTGESEGAVGGQLMVQKKGMYKRILIRKKPKQQFTIIGATRTWDNNLFKTVPNADSGIIDGKVKYFRVLIRRDNCGV